MLDGDWSSDVCSSDLAKKENPFKINEKSIKNGKKLFENFCSSCHGPKATGIKKEITGLNIDTPNLPARLKAHSDGDFHWKILNGRNEMPSFNKDLSDNEIWNIIIYIKDLIKQ
jgi:mono/diheme cytochrome c family protein